ncbi:MAG TPA: sigma-70 family RNA polymerase sigma factor [Ktedonobacteraceae bacterium]|nr:sigma-70 family RNA polymerase sigma factor [Ktedonobacteraceae bacterium]
MTEGISRPVSPISAQPLEAAVTSAPLAGYSASADEIRLVEALRNGSETAFVMLIEQYHRALLRLAMVYVSSRAVAEEVVQETWLGVLQGLQRFEGRSSLKTWIFRILTNCAKTRALREGRSVPFSSLAEFREEDDEPAVEPERFRTADMGSAGQWLTPPQRWDEIPEERLLSQETRARLWKAIEVLPPNQRAVITLRDIEGWDSEEICRFLDISEVNQRVLLHRARARVRRALEMYFDEE